MWIYSLSQSKLPLAEEAIPQQEIRNKSDGENGHVNWPELWIQPSEENNERYDAMKEKDKISKRSLEKHKERISLLYAYLTYGQPEEKFIERTNYGTHRKSNEQLFYRNV